MRRTITLALRDLLAIAAILIAGLALVITAFVAIFILCLQVLARMLW